jgi:alanyl aminopeptidase
MVVLLALLGTAEAGGEAPVGRLGAAVRPLHYTLDLRILPDETGFSGVTGIEVEIAAPTSVIYLHGNDLAVNSARLRTGAGASLAGRYEQVDPTGVARLSFDETVPAGRGTLRIEYSADFGKRGAGLYRSTVGEEAYAFTQFQPIDARRMFPGFDQPEFKTPFDVSVTTRSANAVIGNAPVAAESDAGEGLRRVQFATTLPLPTYLVALAVGPFDLVEATPIPPSAVRKRPLPLRGVATRGKGPQLAYALANTAAMVAYLEAYFDVAFPYPKLDLIASPDFGGGMENAGAIVYGEPRLLLADDASFEQRRGFGGIHAHELAHQWFGDLVTPKWWDDIWLNESFANWMSFKAAHAWEPSLRLDLVPALQTPAAMEIDSRIAARQIRQPVTRNLDIGSAFDGITYLKGGAVLAMFEAWLGEEAFREGIRTHMRRFPHAVADVEDFMASLAEGSRRADVVPVFRSFIDQPGVPLVSARLRCDGEAVTLEIGQSRYLPVGSRGNPQQRWQIPLCVRYATVAGPGKNCTLLEAPRAVMPLGTGSCPAFVMPNADGAGYYRFALDEPGWRALTTNLEALTEAEVLAAADSLSAAYQADRLSTEAFLDAVASFANSRYPQAVMAPGRDLVRMRDYLVPADARNQVLEFMRETYAPRLAGLGVDEQVRPGAATAPVEESLLRTNLVRFLALEAADRDIRSGLAADARRYIGFGKPDAGLDRDAIEPALVEIALAVGVQEGGRGFAEALVARMLGSDDIEFRTRAAAALGSTDDPEVGNYARDLLLDERLRFREPSTIAFALARRDSQRRATFDWLRDHYEPFIGRMAQFAYRFLPTMGAGFCTRAERDEVERFFRPRLGQLPGAERTLAETLEGIELCTALAETKSAEVGRYFR